MVRWACTTSSERDHTDMLHLQVSIADISKIISQRLLETGNALPFNPYAFEIHGPQSYSMIDLQAALEQVTGRQPEIKAIPPDELQEVFKQKLPANKAEEVAEMTVAINGEGIIAKDLDEGTENVERGTVELAETLRQLASGELSKVASGAF